MNEARHILTILAVGDLPRAAEFYRAAFGFETTVDVPVYVQLAIPGGMLLGLYDRTAFGRNTGRVPTFVPPGELTGTEIYFDVDDLDSAVARLLSAPALRDWGDVAAYFADPEGNVLAVARTA